MIDHIALAVTNLEESKAFYTTILGYEVADEMSTFGEYSGMDSVVLKKEESVIVLLASENPDSQVNKFIKNFGPGVQHIGIRVNNIDEVIAKFNSGNDVKEFDIVEGDGIRQVFLKKNIGSGVRIELVERNGGKINDDGINKIFREMEKKGEY